MLDVEMLVRLLKPIAQRWLPPQRTGRTSFEPAHVATLAVDEFERFLLLGQHKASVRARLTLWVTEEAGKQPGPGGSPSGSSWQGERQR
jgi:hypothetical protein